VAVAEIEIDHPHGFQRSQGFGGGEIEPGGLELLFDRAVQQEGECGDVDVACTGSAVW
jgi:hypothetical protein